MNPANIIGEFEGNRLLLGSLPNQKTGFGEHLYENGVRSVLSVNEQDWETKAFGLSVPYNARDWAEVGEEGVRYGAIEAKDHQFLNEESLLAVADFIHNELQSGDVYVHCRAGQGRSAMAIAAYLIIYQNMSPAEAARTIESGRSISTIQNKLEYNPKKGGISLKAFASKYSRVGLAQ